jgi:hypothetical protein
MFEKVWSRSRSVSRSIVENTDTAGRAHEPTFVLILDPFKLQRTMHCTWKDRVIRLFHFSYL